MNAHAFDKDIFRGALSALLNGKDIQHTEVVAAVERWMDSGRNGLLLMGSVGTGKTTLAYAIRRAWTDFLTIARVYKCDWVADQIKRDESWTYEVASCKGLLVLDDFGTENTVYGRESMLPIIFQRYENRMPTVITTNLNSKLIQERYGERVADRLREFSQIVMNFNSLRG